MDEGDGPDPLPELPEESLPELPDPESPLLDPSFPEPPPPESSVPETPEPDPDDPDVHEGSLRCSGSRHRFPWSSGRGLSMSSPDLPESSLIF